MTSIITLRLTTVQRACVLRAIVARRTELVSHIQRLEELGRADVNGKIEILSARAELQCLQDATVAFWSD